MQAKCLQTMPDVKIYPLPLNWLEFQIMSEEQYLRDQQVVLVTMPNCSNFFYSF